MAAGTKKTADPTHGIANDAGELTLPVGGNALGAWTDKLAEYAEEAVALEPLVGGPFVGTRGCVFTVGDKALGNKLNLIVIAYALENDFYVDKFDANNPSSPLCYAIGTKDSEMAPHESCNEPQADQCAGCPQNQWNTSDTGRGKACRNIRRLALVLEDDTEDIAAAPIEYLRIPVTSVNNWKRYVAQLSNDMRRPPFAVLTEVTLSPDPKVQMVMTFRAVGTIDEPADLQDLVKRHKEVQESIGFAYPDYSDAPPAAAAAPAPARAASRRNAIPPAADPVDTGVQTSAPSVPAGSRSRRAPLTPPPSAPSQGVVGSVPSRRLGRTRG